MLHLNIPTEFKIRLSYYIGLLFFILWIVKRYFYDDQNSCDHWEVHVYNKPKFVYQIYVWLYDAPFDFMYAYTMFANLIIMNYISRSILISFRMFISYHNLQRTIIIHKVSQKCWYFIIFVQVRNSKSKFVSRFWQKGYFRGQVRFTSHQVTRESFVSGQW